MLEQQIERWPASPLTAAVTGSEVTAGALDPRPRQAPPATLARIAFELDTADPFDFIDIAHQHGSSFFAWQRGATGPGWIALGSLWQCPTTGPEGFERAQSFCSRIQEQAFGDESGPLLVGGFPFSPQSAVPHGLYVPQLVISRDESGRTRICFHRVVRSKSQLYEQIQELRSNYRKILERLGRPSLQPTQDRLHDSPVLDESYQSWCRRVQDARQAIVRGNLDKVVLARSVGHLAPGGFDPAATARRLRSNHPRAVTFAMSLPHTADRLAFVGATPEPLVEVERHRVATRAIAGTLPRSASPADDNAQAQRLLQSPKDRHEHQLVVDMLARRLGETCTSIHISPTAVLRLPRVMHLQAHLVGHQPNPGGVIDWVRRLHPSPAVGGWPSREATDYLAAHEPLDRGPYAAPIGWVDADGSGQFFVAIRSALLQGNRATAYAGAGIVAASDPDAEWRETQHKLGSVADALVPATTTELLG